jgi:glycine/D-amino acid oxidase-like deaminating enzyme
MRGAVYLHGHAGLYDMTPDTHPISGAGFKKGPAVGEAMADLLLHPGRGHDWVGLRPFAAQRFANEFWRAPWSAEEYTFSSDFGHGL